MESRCLRPEERGAGDLIQLAKNFIESRIRRPYVGRRRSSWSGKTNRLRTGSLAATANALPGDERQGMTDQFPVWIVPLGVIVFFFMAIIAVAFGKSDAFKRIRSRPPAPSKP